MDGTGDHHVKWRKSASQRQVWHILSHLKNLGKTNKQKNQGHESRRGAIMEAEAERGEGGGQREWIGQSTSHTCIVMPWWNPLLCTI
jgi:hypothetical protein